MDRLPDESNGNNTLVHDKLRMSYNFVVNPMNPVKVISEIAAKLKEAEGLRNGASATVETLVAALPARFAFVIGIQDDGDLADVLAAYGIGFTDFRRLETRVAKSSLWKILQLRKPMAIDDLSKDAVLNFLAYGTASRMLISAPITLKETCFGFVGVGFAADRPPDENRTVALLDLVGSMLAQSIRVDRALSRESRKLVEENSILRQELKAKYAYHRIIGNSGAMRQVYDQVTQVARSNSTVLLRGEIGTGKELIANTIHHNSLRSKRPYLKVSCGSFSPDLIDRELFGYESGSAESGVESKKGRIEAADGGTLFLDEIGSIPPSTQVRLLRLLKDRSIERIGSKETIELNIRLITSTATDLEGAAASGAFDRDFFARLSAFSIFLPPLRDRKSDILLLAEHFLGEFEEQYRKDIKRISTPAIDMLTAYHYPGNVRELENAIESAVAVCDSHVIHAHHLPPTLQTAERSGTETRITLTSAVEAFERGLIEDALKSSRGNIAQAARTLDSTERILGYKIGKYKLDPRRFKR